MSSDADRYVLEQAILDKDVSTFFQSKRWNYVVDTTSTGGVFTNQLQFNLDTLASQGSWINLSEAVIQFPIRTRIYNSGSGSQTPAAAGALSTVLKNGFHHMVNSIQVTIDGKVIQQNIDFENINAHFKIVSEWESDALNKWGPIVGLGPLDDFSVGGAAVGLNNVPIGTLIPGARGVDLSTTSNTSISARQYEQNIDAKLPTSAINSIVGVNNARSSGKSNVAGGGANAVGVGQDAYVQFVIATVRLADLSDAIKNMPPTKNLKGFIYVNYNGSSNTFTTASTSTVGAWSYATVQGRSTPVMLQNNASGFQPATGAANTWTLECTISGTPSTTTAVSAAAPGINYGRLVVPYYVPTADIDSALTQMKRVTYNERFLSYIPLTANGSNSVTLTTVSNPTRLILIPYYTSVSADAGATNYTYQPYQSPFEIAPAGTSVLPMLRNLQVYTSNAPIFNSPLNFEYEEFMLELSQMGETGGMDPKMVSGLLNSRLWSQTQRFYTVDLSRHLLADDGSSRAIQVSVDNATNFPMNVIAFVLYQKQFTIQTDLGKISMNN